MRFPRQPMLQKSNISDLVDAIVEILRTWALRRSDIAGFNVERSVSDIGDIRFEIEISGRGDNPVNARLTVSANHIDCGVKYINQLGKFRLLRTPDRIEVSAAGGETVIAPIEHPQMWHSSSVSKVGIRQRHVDAALEIAERALAGR